MIAPFRVGPLHIFVLIVTVGVPSEIQRMIQALTLNGAPLVNADAYRRCSRSSVRERTKRMVAVCSADGLEASCSGRTSHSAHSIMLNRRGALAGVALTAAGLYCSPAKAIVIPPPGTAPKIISLI